MKTLLFASVLVFGFMSPAFALNEATSAPKQVSFPPAVTQTAHAMSTASDLKIALDHPSCDPKGAACYAENSETCCSKICVFSLCQ